MKKQMQNVSFRDLEEFWEFLPDDELRMTERLRNLILECIPDVKEKLSWNVPFFSRHATICFIWPGSISWGNVTNKGVRLGFNKGYLMHDDLGFLNAGKRKQIYWQDFLHVKEIDHDLIRAYLMEAVILDTQYHLEKIEKKKSKSRLRTN
jgi:hypothetical protein